MRNSKNFSFPLQLAIYLMLLGVSLMIGSFVGGFVIWPLMTGTSGMAMQEEMLNPQHYYALVVMQAFITFFIFFLSTWLFALICYRKPNLFLGFNRNINIQQVALVVAVLVLVFPIGGYLSDLTRSLPLPGNWKEKFDAMEASREAQEALLIKIDSLPKYLISMLLIGVLPAIFEEVFFRGGVQNLFTKWFKSPLTAIILTSVIFSVIHLSFYGFFVRFALGVVLGLLFYYSRNLWLPILLHFLFNGLQVTALYIANFKNKTDIKDLEGGIPWYIALVALVVLIFVFRKFKKVSPLPEEEIFYKEPKEDDFQDWIAKNS